MERAMTEIHSTSDYSLTESCSNDMELDYAFIQPRHEDERKPSQVSAKLDGGAIYGHTQTFVLLLSMVMSFEAFLVDFRQCRDWSFFLPSVLCERLFRNFFPRELERATEITRHGI